MTTTPASHPALTPPLAGSDPSLASAWDQIIVPGETKMKLLNHALLSFTMRGGSDPTSLPIHGMALLTGPPGTGKTTLGRGLTSQLDRQLGRRLGPVTLVEANPHALASELHGQTQRGIAAVLEEHVPALAAAGPTVLLLDEVETLAFRRSQASTEANPVDVHRATDAVLAGLDRVARECPTLFIVATTNFEGTVDEAFISRADVVLEIGLPGVRAIESMLRDTLTAVAQQRGAGPGTPLGELIEAQAVEEVAEMLLGRDGRQVRKFVLDVLATDADLALAPERLGAETLRKNAAALPQEREEALNAA